jgi:site-specific recombinase XerD
MVVHGLRVAEVAGMLVGNVDLEAGTVKVHGKGSKRRTVYLVEGTAAALRDWLDVRASVALEGVNAVFVVVGNHTNDTAMSERALRYLVEGYLDGLGLKAEGISCHCLRHSAATWTRFGVRYLEAVTGT